MFAIISVSVLRRFSHVDLFYFHYPYGDRHAHDDSPAEIFSHRRRSVTNHLNAHNESFFDFIKREF